MNPNYFQNPSYPVPNFLFHPRPHLPPHPAAPPPPYQVPPTTAAAPILDLSITISSLANLISLSQQTLDSLSSLQIKPTNKNANFISCPFDSRHLMPPESLFLHSLRCPSPLFEDPSSLFTSLHYPTTLNIQKPSKTFLFINSNDTDCLYLSLDSFYNKFGSNFFYKDCPGVVEFNDLEDGSSKTVMLPSVLSVECADFVSRDVENFKGFDKSEFRIFPSDLWVIMREVEGWVDYPSMYSYSVFCAILKLNLIKGSDLRSWVIANSPRYGVVIDVYMRDHISALFRLCLNAIRREALGFVGHCMVSKSMSFSCPVLGQVLTWIVSQLSVLYGETKAKSFAIHIFRQCVIDVSYGVLLFPLEKQAKERPTEVDDSGRDVADVKRQEPLEGSIESKIVLEVNENVDREVICLSQVAASVAALRERSLLEGKIKALRISQPRQRHQRMIEHDSLSKRADEARKKRSNYRPIIDHDGLPRKQLSNQETSKTKTRQELLAEERDYKRRRMSYRGKKLKRTTLQVMRDMIEEFTDEIKQAGGIGCFEKAAEEETVSPIPPLSSNFTSSEGETRKGISKSSEATRASPNHRQNQSHKEASTQDYGQRGKGYHRHREQVEYQRSTSKDGRGKDHHSRTAVRRRSHGPLHEQDSLQRKRDVIMRHERWASGRSEYHNYKSSDSLYSENYHGVQVNGDRLDVNDQNLRNSSAIPMKEFEDRYNPSESHGDDV